MLTVCLASSQEARGFYESTRHGALARAVVTGFSNRLLNATFRQGAFGDFLVAGFAGALRPDLSPGSLFLPRIVQTPDGHALAPDLYFQNSLVDALIAENIPFTEGTLLTAKEPVVSGQQRDFFRGRGADAVDMESHELLEYLARLGRRVGVLRIVSDRADEQAATDYRESLPALSERLSDALNRVLRRLAGLSPADLAGSRG